MLETEGSGGRSLTPVVVQKLVAGVWVSVFTTDCRPNYTFQLPGVLKGAFGTLNVLKAPFMAGPMS